MTMGFVVHFPFWVSAILNIILHVVFWTVIILAGLLLAGFVYWAPGYLLKSVGIADVFSSLSLPTVIYMLVMIPITSAAGMIPFALFVWKPARAPTQQAFTVLRLPPPPPNKRGICDYFTREASGEWVAVSRVRIEDKDRYLDIRPGTHVRPGVQYNGFDVGGGLEEKCTEGH
jgi:hypothetical protein